ncbi:hypothetical protein DY000_02020816 [Brassica cretica]|uniref:Solute carrier family 40 protein n=1 Tax=Brassica cretica TaxID=69181 RepID=A0ABQ7E5X0_BRACR|nr:hypothetical protein DY000_02020816 [Brassica cretica]
MVSGWNCESVSCAFASVSWLLIVPSFIVHLSRCLESRQSLIENEVIALVGLGSHFSVLRFFSSNYVALAHSFSAVCRVLYVCGLTVEVVSSPFGHFSAGLQISSLSLDLKRVSVSTLAFGGASARVPTPERLSPVKCAAREVLRLRRGRFFVDSRRGPFSVSRSASGLSLCRELRLVFFFVNGGSVLDHVYSGDSSRRKRVLSGRVQAEMADLSVQTYVVSLEGFNQVVVHGSCGLVDANPLRPEFFVRAPSLVSLAVVEAFALDCLFGSMTHLASRFSGVINRLGVSLWSLLAVPRPSYFLMVVAVASACSVWEAFQALCDVVYKSGLLVLHRRRHGNSRHPRKRGEPHLPVTIVEAWYRLFGSQRTHLASRFSGVINRLGVSLWSLLAVPRPRYFLMVAAVASAYSVWEAFQGLCDVVYKPGLLVVSSRNTPLLFVERLIDGIGYMLCGVHLRLATP